jgi:hypothetical protein
MRYKNQLGLVFAEIHWTTTCVVGLDRRTAGRLVAHAKELRAVPILAQCRLISPIVIRAFREEKTDEGMLKILVKEGDLEVPEATVESLSFENLLTNRALNEAEFNLTARNEISDWEVLDLAIDNAGRRLEEQGFSIEQTSSELNDGPHILANKAGEVHRVVVGASRYPETEPIFDQNRIMTSAEDALIYGGNVARMSISIAHAEDQFTGENPHPLFRGEELLARVDDIEIIDPVGSFTDRSVRVFVSSTFMDFDRERNILTKRVLPELQRRASECGVSVSVVDLRWGVTRESSLNRRAMDICFREIDKARPFFVALIGERYGSIVTQNTLSELRNKTHWLPAKVEEASMTSLEIHFAMLRPNCRNSGGFVYYRAQPPGLFQERRPKIASQFHPLIQSLIQRGYELKAIGENFETDVTESLWRLVRKHYPEDNSSDHALISTRRHRQYGIYRGTALPPGCELVRQLRCLQEGLRTTAFQCASSWEASALAGAVAHDARKEGSRAVFEHYLSLSPVNGLMELIERLADFVSRTTNLVGGMDGGGLIGSGAIAMHLERLERWARESGRNILIIVAETDLLGSSEAAVLKNLKARSNVDVVLTRTQGENEALDTSSFKFTEAHWSQEERADFIRTYIGRSNKALDEEDIQFIANHPMAVDLSFLRVILDQLVNWSTFETLYRDIHTYISVKDFKELAELMHVRALDNVESRDWRAFIRAVFTGEQFRTEQDIIEETGIEPSAFFGAMAVASLMMDSWAGRVWKHRGVNWSVIVDTLLKKADAS